MLWKSFCKPFSVHIYNIYCTICAIRAICSLQSHLYCQPIRTADLIGHRVCMLKTWFKIPTELDRSFWWMAELVKKRHRYELLKNSLLLKIHLYNPFLQPIHLNTHTLPRSPVFFHGRPRSGDRACSDDARREHSAHWGQAEYHAAGGAAERRSSVGSGINHKVPGPSTRGVLSGGPLVV